MVVPPTRPAPADRYLLERGRVLLTGVQALARLPLDVRRADRRSGRSTAGFISGYEGSPLGGYDLELARNRSLLQEHDIVFRPGVNEELAATAVQGTQLASTLPDKRVDGVTGFWYGKSPGLDRAADAVRHANLMGTHPAGGVLALVGDDPAAKSSTVPGASDLLLADLGLPTLYPWDSQSVLELGRHGVAMSRASGLWVALKITTNVADGAGTVHLDRLDDEPVMPDRTVDGVEFRHVVSAMVVQPGLGLLEQSREGARLEIARRYAAVNRLDRIPVAGRADRIGIVAAGKTFTDVRHALALMGLDDAELGRRGVRLLHLAMIHPLEPSIVHRFAEGLGEIIVVEEKRPLLERALKDVLYGRSDVPAVIGKRRHDGAELFPAHGELDQDTIAARLAPVLAAAGQFPTVEDWLVRRRPLRERIELPVVGRTPYFCSGCPHNVATRTPPGATVGAGIGCHGMVTTMDTGRVGEVLGMTQMGGEGAQWIGMQPFLERRHLIQNLGDGTFHHSGSLAVRAAVAAGAHITFKLLYNSAVAMTGGQQPAGMMSVPQLCASLIAEGVARVIVTADDPARYPRGALPRGVEVWSRDRLVEAQQVLAGVAGVTVLVHDQECAAELRRKRRRGLAPAPLRRVVINERVCEGCGDCGQKSNCLSVQPVQTEFGRKTRIDQFSCNTDYTCLDGDCPSFLTVLPGRRTRARDTTQAVVDTAALPDPPARAGGSAHTTRIAGIGGSGVVTLSQILGTAAATAGYEVRGLDQTGLAQKGGAVVSDVKIAPVSAEGPRPPARSNKAAAQECDLYLGCDLLVAADARNLAAVDPERTVAVVSTSPVPTGQMVVDPAVGLPDPGPLTRAIRASVAEARFLDARALSVALLGDDQFANLLLAGIAHQLGALPLPAAAIEQAIERNGVRVAPNIEAFRLGRLAVADPAAFAALAGSAAVPAPDGGPETELDRLLAVRVPDLVAYHSDGYAQRYRSLVERVRRVEAERVPGATGLSEAVAHHLYKLMAYKDEYEVARLLLDPAVERAVREQFGPDARISYRLHPPVLRALGMRRKVELGPWFRPALRVLAGLRRLRGTAVDPFGATRVRRAERRLVTEYEATIDRLLAGLHPGNHGLAVEIAALPDLIRGFEEVKMANIARYAARRAELLAEFAESARADEQRPSR